MRGGKVFTKGGKRIIWHGETKKTRNHRQFENLRQVGQRFGGGHVPCGVEKKAKS